MDDIMNTPSVLDAFRTRLQDQKGEPEIVVERQDLRDWPLAGAVLTGVNLIDCDLRGCDLTGTDFGSGHHALSRFCAADLSGALLAKATFDNADFRDAVLIDARARRASFVGADLRRADLSGADLERAHLAGADLRDAKLCGANLTQAALDGAKLHGADLAGAHGLETAFSDTIDVGADDQPLVLHGDEARAWLLQASST
jgi:uncharacterized protein YjbI with pentapeptide repeats